MIDQLQVKSHEEINSEDTLEQVRPERCQREQMSVFSAKAEVLLQTASPTALVFHGNQYPEKGFYLLDYTPGHMKVKEVQKLTGDEEVACE